MSRKIHRILAYNIVEERHEKKPNSFAFIAKDLLARL